MSKKHVFLQFFSKIAIFACVFCTIPAWSETTCDIDYTPVTGNSIQNGTPTPTNPVEIESVGTKVGNKYAVQVAVNYDGGVVDLGTLNWRIAAGENGLWSFVAAITDLKGQEGTGPNVSRLEGIYVDSDTYVLSARYFAYAGNFALENDHYIKAGLSGDAQLHIRNDNFSDATAFKQAMSGVMLYYQRTTDETWTAPTLRTVYLDEPLRKVGDYADVLDYKNGQIIRNVGVKVLDGTETDITWNISSTYAGSIYTDNLLLDRKHTGGSVDVVYCSHLKTISSGASDYTYGGIWVAGTSLRVNLWLFDHKPTQTEITEYLAQQYAAGTPVTVYYPLATPVVEQIENWSCTPPITDIKIATTKYVDDEFAPLNTALENAISVVDNVVTQTIAQAGQIATLQNTKQTRPDDNNECPAGKKCLLVTDESGTPHWYEIIEP